MGGAALTPRSNGLSVSLRTGAVTPTPLPVSSNVQVLRSKINLSSGVAGTMAANGSGLQLATIRNLLMAWVLTLPAAIMRRPASTCCSRTCSESAKASRPTPRDSFSLRRNRKAALKASAQYRKKKNACMGMQAFSHVHSFFVMPGLVPGIHDFLCRQDVDGRDRPGHDERWDFSLTPAARSPPA
jgi:hypothetical protein